MPADGMNPVFQLLTALPTPVAQSHVLVDGQVAVSASEGTWVQVTAVATAVGAFGTLIAAFLAGLAVWFNFMPWCDLVDIGFAVVEGGNAVEMSATVHNAGRGQALVARWTLVSYEGAGNLPDSTKYLGPLFPDERRPIQHTVQLPSSVTQVLAPEYAMLLRWDTLFGVYGETFVETYPAHSGRKRIRVRWNPFSIRQARA